MEDKIQFARAICGYLREIAREQAVSTSHDTLRTLYELYSKGRVERALREHWARERHLRKWTGKDTSFFCEKWDSDQRLDPHPVVVIGSGLVVGQLQSTDWEAVEHAPGIQDWSRA